MASQDMHLANACIEHLGWQPDDGSWRFTEAMKSYIRRSLRGVSVEMLSRQQILDSEPDLKEFMDEGNFQEDREVGNLEFLQDDQDVPYRILRYKLLALLRCPPFGNSMMLEALSYSDEMGQQVRNIGEMAARCLARREEMCEILRSLQQTAAMALDSSIELEMRQAFQQDTDAFLFANQGPPEIVVLGDTNAGKSSFVNCMLEERLLPDNIGPCTHAICHIESAERDGMAWAPLDCDLEDIPWTDIPLEGTLADILTREVAPRGTEWAAEAAGDAHGNPALGGKIYKIAHRNQTLAHVKIIDTPGINDAAGSAITVNGCQMLKTTAERGLLVLVVNVRQGARAIVRLLLENDIHVTRDNTVVVLTNLDEATQAQTAPGASPTQATDARNSVFNELQRLEGLRMTYESFTSEFVIECNLQLAMSCIEGSGPLLDGRVAAGTQVVTRELSVLRQRVAERMKACFTRRTRTAATHCRGMVAPLLAEVSPLLVDVRENLNHTQTIVDEFERVAQGRRQQVDHEVQTRQAALAAHVEHQRRTMEGVNAFLAELREEFDRLLTHWQEASVQALRSDLETYLTSQQFLNAFEEESAAECVRLPSDDARLKLVAACVQSAVQQMTIHVHNCILRKVTAMEDRHRLRYSETVDEAFNRRLGEFTLLLGGIFGRDEQELRRNHANPLFATRFQATVREQRETMPQRLRADYTRIQEIVRRHGVHFDTMAAAYEILSVPTELPAGELRRSVERSWRLLSRLFHEDGGRLRAEELSPCVRRQIRAAYSAIDRARGVALGAAQPVVCTFHFIDDTAAKPDAPGAADIIGRAPREIAAVVAADVPVSTRRWWMWLTAGLGPAAAVGGTVGLVVAETAVAVIAIATVWGAIGLVALGGACALCKAWSVSQMRSQPAKFARKVLKQQAISTSHHRLADRIRSLPDQFRSKLTAATLAAYTPFCACARKWERSMGREQEELAARVEEWEEVQGGVVGEAAARRAREEREARDTLEREQVVPLEELEARLLQSRDAFQAFLT